MNKRGFTLIELLAVIVILAIIALIAVPIVLNIIDNTKDQSRSRTAESIAHEVELAHSSYLLKNSGDGEADDFCTYMTKEYFAVNNGNIILADDDMYLDCEDESTVTVKSGKDYYDIVYNEGIVKVYYFSEEDDPVELLATVTLKSKSAEKYVYLWYEESYVSAPSINDDGSDLSTTLSADKTWYLKFKLNSSNVVTNAYACAKFNEVEYCVEGGNSNYYGWVTNKNNSTGNVAKIYEIEQENITNVSCDFNSDYSSCGDGSFSLDASSNGFVSVNADFYSCSVYASGSSSCGSI